MMTAECPREFAPPERPGSPAADGRFLALSDAAASVRTPRAAAKDATANDAAPNRAAPNRAAPNRAAPNRAAGNDGGGGKDGGSGGGRGNTGVVLKTRTKTKKPSMYKVLMLNDDYTPMEFVILVLERFFGKNQDEATQIMLHVHRRGVGVCGVYTYEVAETKVTQVIDFARKHEHPLQCTLEKE